MEKELEFIMLVGLPACGKTTWAEQYVRNRFNYSIISTDDFYEQYAYTMRITYQEAFEKVDFKDAQRYFDTMLNNALEMNKNIIWDQTNLNTLSRRKKLKKIPDKYLKIARVFDVDEKTRVKQSEKRWFETGKSIPLNAIQRMKQTCDYNEVNLIDEGFDKVIYHRNEEIEEVLKYG